MNIKKYTTILTLAFALNLMLAITSSAEAKENSAPASISDTFGVELGEPAPAEDTVEPYFLAQDRFTFEFFPLDVDSTLATYLFYTTPVSGLVYKIEAFTRFNQFNSCEKERQNLSRLMGERLGKKPNKSQSSPNIFSTSEFKQGNRLATTTCIALAGESKLTVSFVDLGTKEKVLKEYARALSEPIKTN